jgi:hypothetical protein
VPISIHPDLEARLRSRAQAEGITVEAYVERIARDDERAEAELEALALEGLQSGEPLPASDDYWMRKRQQLHSKNNRSS